MGKGEDPPEDGRWLGAGDLEAKDQLACVFVPSKTRDGRALDHGLWREEAVSVMSTLFGGATAMEGFGGWLDVEEGRKVKLEAISMIVSFIAADEWNEENALQLKQFLHRMGREAEQGEIGIFVNGNFFRIRRFNHEEA